MKILSLSLALLAASVTNVHGDEIPGYRTAWLQWEVESFPGGPNITVNGTIEEVYHHLSQINPNFHNDYPLVEVDVVTNQSLTKRYTKRELICNKRWHPAGEFPYRDGISYLRRVAGRPSRGPGPGSCGRVSCSWSAAIWWCNDTPDTLLLDSFNDIADAAQAVIDGCLPIYNKEYGWHYYPHTLAGQIFYTEGWNAILRADDCERYTWGDYITCLHEGDCNGDTRFKWDEEGADLDSA